MSDSDPTVLGKRLRDGVDGKEQGKLANEPTTDSASHTNDTVDDEDEDDIGPMPLPASGGVVKKKRKGVLNGSFFNPMASNNTRYLFLPRIQFCHTNVYIWSTSRMPTSTTRALCIGISSTFASSQSTFSSMTHSQFELMLFRAGPIF